jgi:hypothetical protein
VAQQGTTFSSSSSFPKSAVNAAYEAKKETLRTAYSCNWAVRDARYVVQSKEETGTEADQFHVVTWSLKPEGQKETLWLVENYGESSDIRKEH